MTAPSTTASAPAAPSRPTSGASSPKEALGVAIQPDPDGRIVVAGYLRNEVTVACYQPNGQLDETFGTDGVVSGIATGSPTTWPSTGRPDRHRRPHAPEPPSQGRLRRSVRRPAPRGWTDGRSFGLDGLVVTDVAAEQRGPERRRPAGRRNDRHRGLQPEPGQRRGGHRPPHRHRPLPPDSPTRHSGRAAR